jgi:flagellar protein FlbD
MILVHRLDGGPMFLNDELIESIEATPETVVTMVDGRRLVLSDKPSEVVEAAVRFRASVLATLEGMRRGDAETLHLHPVDDPQRTDYPGRPDA